MREDKSLLIIGDVHGCYNTLMALISKFPEKEKSRLVFVGDIIDRGKYSAHVVDFIKNGGYECVKGNHEAMMIEALSLVKNERIDYQYNPMRLWKLNGGTQTLRSYYYRLKNYNLMKEHLVWMKQLKNYLEFDIPDENGKKLFVTHGFGLPFWKSKDIDEAQLRNNRLKKNSPINGTYPVFNVFGHDADETVRITDTYAAIDTGCVYGRLSESKKECYLSALEWPSKKIYTQKYIG